MRSVDPKQGQRLLEIAAGPGDTGFLAASLLGNGRLVSTDIAPAVVEAARKRGAELGIDNADFRVIRSLSTLPRWDQCFAAYPPHC